MSFKSAINYCTKKNTGKFSILYSWIISYLIVCTLLFVCNLTLLSSYTKESKNHLERNYFDFLNSIVLQFDDRIAHADDLYTLISSDSAVNSIISTNTPLSVEKTYPISSMLSNQSKYTVFSQVYLYFPEQRMVISDSVTDTDNNFFNCYYQDMNLTFNEWKDSLYNAKHSTTLLSFNGKERYLDFMYRIDTKNVKNSSYAVLVFRVSDIAFKTIAYTQKTGYTLILDQNSNVVMSTSANIPEHFNYDNYNHNEIFRSNGTVSLCTTSSYTGWKFLHIDTVDGFYSVAEKIKNIHLIFILITMLVCSTLSVFFTVINYRPLHKLISTYRRASGLPSEKISYNYSLIKEVLNDYVRGKQSLYNLEKKLHTSNINEELYKLLQNPGKTSKNEVIGFPSEFFTVILFRPYNISNLFGETSETNEEYDISFFIIQNTMEELFNSDGYFKLVKYNDYFAGVYCYKNQSSTYTYKTNIADNLNFGLSVVKENFQFGCDIAISSVKSGFGGIFSAMKEAQSVLSSISEGVGDVVFYDDFKDLNIHPLTNTLQSSEIAVNNIFLCIEKRNLNEAVSALDKLRGICTKSLDSTEEQKLLLSLWEGVSAIAEKVDSHLVSSGDYEAFSYENSEKAWDFLKEMIEKICTIQEKGGFRQNHTVDSSNLLAEIVSYIGKNYADCNLCTDFMSNKYGFSSRYISKLFKSEIGKSFSEYLTQYRIEKAKILLKTTSESISQIYRQCGFVSEKTFFRSFSKYENVTPGKYRELNQQCTY